MRQHNGMRPYDIVILLKLISLGNQPWQYRDLAADLYIPLSEISVSFKRSEKAGLINMEIRKVHRQSFMEFLEFGLKYVFPISPQAMVTGTATAHSHPFYKQYFEAEMKYAWPDDAGNIRGLYIEPLHSNVPKASKRDDLLYKLLASVDILRIGRVRELRMATEELKKAII